MRILICEDSEHNLISAREFAEKVKDEHEVVIYDKAWRAASDVAHSEREVGSHWNGEERIVKYGAKIDLVLTDLYLPTHKGESLPGGLIVALAALQAGIPVCIITDGHAHSEDETVSFLAGVIQHNNERLHLYLLQDETSKGFKGWSAGGWRTGKLVKDWEFCFQQLTQGSVSA